MPEEMLEWVNDVNKFRIEYGIGDFIDVIKNGTPIPDNATNGDVIKAMFDVTEEDFYDEDRMVDVYGLDRTDDPSTFYADWWNALYKR